MDILQLDPRNRRQVRDFLDLPFRLYHDIPQWVPPLRMDDLFRLDPKRHPFYRHSSAGFFLVYQKGIPVGRLAVLDHRLYNDLNGKRTAFFSHFECERDWESARGLFEMGFEWARKRSLDTIFGPRGFTALDGFGLLVKGFEHRPAFGLPYNLPYYEEYLEALGFERFEDSLSGYLRADLAFPERIHELARRIEEKRGLYIAHFHNRRELHTAISHLKELYNLALAGMEDGLPITDQEVKLLSDQMLWFADPNLVKIVMKDEKPVGFLLAYPDISEGMQKIRGRLFPFGWLSLLKELHRTDWININGAGMLPEYRGLGGTAILYSELFRSVQANPRYRHAEVVQIGMANERMQRELENFGVDFYKVHRIYQRRL